MRAGAKGEAEAAYEIDFHHRASTRWAVIHDLRLEHKGRVAQIDHLLISRSLDIWVCESKHFAEGVAVNEQGEFIAFYAGRAVGVPSPFEQNRKHIALLREVLDSERVNLPKRLGLAIKPSLESVVLVSKNARIGQAATDGADPHEGRLSTSRLASARGLRSSKELLERLVAAGYLAVGSGGEHLLTDAGRQAGGVWIAKSRFGPYFLWPKDLVL